MESIITWMGGKRQLREIIAKYVPKDIKGYIEPFGGAGWVLLYRERWARLEVWNDLDNELYNMFMQVKFHPDELTRELELMLHSRKLFDVIRSQKGITEIQRAARFIYLIRHSFGALGTSFGTGKSNGGGIRSGIALERIGPLAKRLDMVTVENLDYKECLGKYDDPNNFFYLDPPYTHGHSYANARNFNHHELREILGGLRGRWLLSYDDSAEVRELYSPYTIIPVVRKQGIKNPDADYREVLVMNY